MDKRLLDLLVCPLCKGDLIYRPEDRELICKAERVAFPIRDEIPMMLESEARRLSLEEYDALSKKQRPAPGGGDAVV